MTMRVFAFMINLTNYKANKPYHKYFQIINLNQRIENSKIMTMILGKTTKIIKMISIFNIIKKI